MERRPVSFQYKEVVFTGYFTQVAGAGSTSVWHLFNNGNYYKGRLRMNYYGEWVFDGNEMNELAKYFGEILIQHTNNYQ